MAEYRLSQDMLPAERIEQSSIIEGKDDFCHYCGASLAGMSGKVKRWHKQGKCTKVYAYSD